MEGWLELSWCEKWYGVGAKEEALHQYGPASGRTCEVEEQLEQETIMRVGVVCNIIVVGDSLNGVWRAVMQSELVCTVDELDMGQLGGAARLDGVNIRERWSWCKQEQLDHHGSRCASARRCCLRKTRWSSAREEDLCLRSSRKVLVDVILCIILLDLCRCQV